MYPRQFHSLGHLTRSWLLAVVVMLGMAASMILPATAQPLANSPTAAQFFNAVESGSLMASASGATVLHTPLGDFVGASGPEQFGAELHQTFSDVEFSTQSIETVEHLVIVRFTMTAIQTGTFNGLEANCAGIAVPGVIVLRFGNRMNVNQNPDSEAAPSTLDPAYSMDAYVTEQWLGYDTGQIASQIATFNALDATVRPGCDDWSSSLPVAPDSGSEDPLLPPATDEPVQWENPY